MKLRLKLMGAALGMMAAAVPGSAMAGDHPNFEGFWQLDFRPVAGAEALQAQLPPNTVVLEDTGIVEFGIGEFGGLQVRPDAVAKAKLWKPADEMTLPRVCAAPSLVYAIQGPFPFEIYQTDKFIIFKYEYFDQVRIVFMDGRDHPPADAPHSKTGHSIGHWEGEELVIDTTHFSVSTITNNGLDHSEAIHMVERYRLNADSTQLTAVQWFEDSQVLDNNGARFIHWAKQDGQFVFPYDCDPSFALEYQSVAPAGAE